MIYPSWHGNLKLNYGNLQDVMLDLYFLSGPALYRDRIILAFTLTILTLALHGVSPSLLSTFPRKIILSFYNLSC